MSHVDDYESIINEYDRYIKKIALRFHKSKSINIDDVIQESKIAIFYALPTFYSKYNKNALKSWIGKITSNTAKMYLRSSYSRIRNEKIIKENSTELYTDPDIDIDEENKRLLNLIKKYINLLPDQDKNLIMLHYYKDLPYSEISKLLNIKETTLRSQVCRGLAVLKEIITLVA